MTFKQATKQNQKKHIPMRSDDSEEDEDEKKENGILRGFFCTWLNGWQKTKYRSLQKYSDPELFQILSRCSQNLKRVTLKFYDQPTQCFR